jgi:hypothetical protein
VSAATIDFAAARADAEAGNFGSRRVKAALASAGMRASRRHVRRLVDDGVLTADSFAAATAGLGAAA